jgi:4-hydroxy 2-oxovalerate aldolase
MHAQFSFKTLHDRTGGDNSCIMLLSLLQTIGVKKIAIAGFDGHRWREDNYFDTSLELTADDDLNEKMEKQLTSFFASERSLEVNWLTPSRFNDPIIEI